MKMFKITVPGKSLEEIQDGHMSFFDFLTNYGSSAWSRIVEGEYIEEMGESETTLEFMSFNREDLEVIEPGLTRGVLRYLEDSYMETWEFKIEEVEI